MLIGEVRPFKYVYADDKRQFTKPLEEAAELFVLLFGFRVLGGL